MTKILGLAVAVISVAAFAGTATASQNAQHAKRRQEADHERLLPRPHDRLLRLRPDQAQAGQQARADLDRHKPSTADSTTSSTPFPARATTRRSGSSTR